MSSYLKETVNESPEWLASALIYCAVGCSVSAVPAIHLSLHQALFDGAYINKWDLD